MKWKVKYFIEFYSFSGVIKSILSIWSVPHTDAADEIHRFCLHSNFFYCRCRVETTQMIRQTSVNAAREWKKLWRTTDEPPLLWWSYIRCKIAVNCVVELCQYGRRKCLRLRKTKSKQKTTNDNARNKKINAEEKKKETKNEYWYSQTKCTFVI